jgi:hypothetical protein
VGEVDGLTVDEVGHLVEGGVGEVRLDVLGPGDPDEHLVGGRCAVGADADVEIEPVEDPRPVLVLCGFVPEIDRGDGDAVALDPVEGHVEVAVVVHAGGDGEGGPAGDHAERRQQHETPDHDRRDVPSRAPTGRRCRAGRWGSERGRRPGRRRGCRRRQLVVRRVDHVRHTFIVLLRRPERKMALRPIRGGDNPTTGTDRIVTLGSSSRRGVAPTYDHRRHASRVACNHE